MATKDIARLEARIDHLAEKIVALTTRLDSHLDNHHGRISQVKTSGMTAILATLVMALWELVRHFYL